MKKCFLLIVFMVSAIFSIAQIPDSAMKFQTPYGNFMPNGKIDTLKSMMLPQSQWDYLFSLILSSSRIKASEIDALYGDLMKRLKVSVAK